MYALGVVMLPHGLQKLFGMFGGNGFEATLNSFHDFFGVPALLTVLVILAESFGAAGLILGFLTRLCAFGILLVMLGAVQMVHWKNGFFMNWYGSASGEGIEYHILAIGMAVALLFTGGGKFSVDRMLARRL